MTSCELAGILQVVAPLIVADLTRSGKVPAVSVSSSPPARGRLGDTASYTPKKAKATGLGSCNKGP